MISRREASPRVACTIRLWRGALVAGVLILFGAGARAATPVQVVKARAAVASTSLRAGASARAAVTATIVPGYHINDHKPSLDYLIPTELKLDPSNDITVAEVRYPKGTPKKFSFFDTPISVYEGTLRLAVTLKASPSARPGDYTLKGKLAYQACNDQACLAPTSAPLTLAVKVLPAAAHRARVKSDGFN